MRSCTVQPQRVLMVASIDERVFPRIGVPFHGVLDAVNLTLIDHRIFLVKGNHELDE